MSLLWKYVRNYALYAVIAALFMICEVLTDLLQPDLMRYIIDDGIFGIRTYFHKRDIFSQEKDQAAFRKIR